MEFFLEIPIDHEIREVISAFDDEAFWEHKSLVGQTAISQLDISGTSEDGFVVSIKRSFANTRIKSEFSSFLPDTVEFRLVEAWSEAKEGPEGNRYGTVSVEVAGVPVRISGFVKLLNDEPNQAADTSKLVYQGDITTNIPLVGHFIESAISQALTDFLQQDADILHSWLIQS